MSQREKDKYAHGNKILECMHLKKPSMRSILKYYIEVVNSNIH